MPVRRRPLARACVSACFLAATGFATLGASPAVAAPKPECGSLESLRAGNPYSGNISVHHENLTAQVKEASFGRQESKTGRLGVGKVTAKFVESEGERVAKLPWVSIDGYVYKVMNQYQVSDTERKEQYGEYVCDPETGAVQTIRADRIQVSAGGGEWRRECFPGGSCGWTKTPDSVDVHRLATLKLTSQAE